MYKIESRYDFEDGKYTIVTEPNVSNVIIYDMVGMASS